MEKLHENPFIVNELKHILKVDYTISNILCLISCGDPVGATSGRDLEVAPTEERTSNQQ